MRGLRFSGLLAALLVALGLAFVPPAWAERKAGAPKSSAAEARYDNSRQAALLQQQISVLAPQKKGVTDIYALGIAGWTTDVFRNELAGALKITSKALPLNGGTVRLINSRETADTIPLASRQNFAAAVRGIARIMDKEEDVLFLFMTSHGEKRSLGLQLPSTIVRLKPSEVAAVLDREGIKNRVVIVSACYSGIFVKPLADENTIVLTAADQKSTSFGCAEGREWTYFGDALFHHSLKPGTDFRDAFAKARGLIAEWEKRDRFTASNPQGHFGEALMRKLAPLIQERERTNDKNRALDNARQGWSDNQDDQKSACSIGRGQGGPCPTDAAREAAPDVPFAVMPLHPGPNAFQDDDCGLGDPVASSSPPFLPCGTAG